jgi:hypothetical protein
MERGAAGDQQRRQEKINLKIKRFATQSSPEN